MAFIPIDAKADIEGSKKGKLTPAQHAQLNAWCLASKTGILDCLGRCETYNGEMTYSVINGKASIVLKSGYLVICGRLVECEEGTIVEVNAPTIGTVSGKIVARFDLSRREDTEFEIYTKTTALTQQDLNENVYSGIYELELYSYQATTTSVTLSPRTQAYVPDIGGKLLQFEASLKDEGKPLHDYDDTKGTIEERLTGLGFRFGGIAATANNTGGVTIVPDQSYIRQLGKVIYGTLAIRIANGGFNASDAKEIGTISSNISEVETEREIVNFGIKTMGAIDLDGKYNETTIRVLVSIRDKSLFLGYINRAYKYHISGTFTVSFVVDIYNNEHLGSKLVTYPVPR